MNCILIGFFSPNQFEFISSLFCRRIVTEYEKTIAQMIGEYAGSAIFPNIFASLYLYTVAALLSFSFIDVIHTRPNFTLISDLQVYMPLNYIEIRGLGTFLPFTRQILPLLSCTCNAILTLFSIDPLYFCL